MCCVVLSWAGCGETGCLLNMGVGATDCPGVRGQLLELRCFKGGWIA